MDLLARWELRAPVHTLRTQCAEWNPEAGDWGSFTRRRFVATFRPDGQLSDIAYQNPDGSAPRQILLYDEGDRLIEDQWWSDGTLIRRVVHAYDADGRSASAVTVDADGMTHEGERCEYDESGRKTKVVVLRAPTTGDEACSPGSYGMSYGVEGTTIAISAPGAVTSLTEYDDHERPSQVSFRDAGNAVVSRVVFSRDQEGRVLTERIEFHHRRQLVDEALDPNMPTTERALLMQLLGTVFEDSTFSVATYTYDEQGNRIETVRRTGTLSEERVTVRYDHSGNPIEEVRSDVRREVHMDGGAMTAEERSHVQHVRFEYQYDAHGNWIERAVWQRIEPNTDLRPSNVERRTLTYYAK